MVSSNYHQGFSIPSCPFEYGTYGTVEVVCFLHQQVQVVEVTIVVQLGTFNHHEETFLVLAHDVHALQCRLCQSVATFCRNRSIFRFGHCKDLTRRDGFGFFPTTGYLIAFCFEFLEDVASVRSVLELLRSPSYYIVGTAIHIVGYQIVFIVTVDVVATEVCRSGIPQTASHRNTSRHAFLLRQGNQRRQFISIDINTYIMVIGLLTGSDGCTTRTRISNQLVCTIGLRQAYRLTVVQIQLSPIGCPCRVDVHQAHTVANHQNDVLHFLSFRSLDFRHIVWILHHISMELGFPCHFLCLNGRENTSPYHQGYS